ncbi:MAG: hypothetical protein RX318_11570, partial [bacterium]|nr:hypothetical protein [bacterium]
MTQSKRWVSVSTLAIPFIVVLGLFLGSITFAQEDYLRTLTGSTTFAQEDYWKTLTEDALWFLQQGKYQEGVEVAKEALEVAEDT